MSAVEILVAIIGLLLVALFGSTRLTKRAQAQRDDAMAEARTATKQAAVHEAAATSTASVAVSQRENAQGRAQALQAVENARQPTQIQQDGKSVEDAPHPQPQAQETHEGKEWEATKNEAKDEETGDDMEELLRLAAEQVGRTRARGRLLDSAR